MYNFIQSNTKCEHILVRDVNDNQAKPVSVKSLFTLEFKRPQGFLDRLLKLMSDVSDIQQLLRPDVEGILSKVILDTEDCVKISGMSVDDRMQILSILAHMCSFKDALSADERYFKGEILKHSRNARPLVELYRVIDANIPKDEMLKEGVNPDKKVLLGGPTSLEEVIDELDEVGSKFPNLAGVLRGTRTKQIYAVGQLLDTFKCLVSEEERLAFAELFRMPILSRKSMAKGIVMTLLKVFLEDPDISYDDISSENKTSGIEWRKMKYNGMAYTKVLSAVTDQHVYGLAIPSTPNKQENTVIVDKKDNVVVFCPNNDSFNYVSEAVSFQSVFKDVDQVVPVPQLEALEDVPVAVNFVKMVEMDTGEILFVPSRPYIHDTQFVETFKALSNKRFEGNALSSYLSKGTQKCVAVASQLFYNKEVLASLNSRLATILANAGKTHLMAEKYNDMCNQLITDDDIEINVKNMDKKMEMLEKFNMSNEFSRGLFSYINSSTGIYPNLVLDWHYSLYQLFGEIPWNRGVICTDSFKFCEYFYVRKTNKYHSPRRHPGDNPVFSKFHNWVEKFNKDVSVKVTMIVNFTLVCEEVTTQKDIIEWSNVLEYRDVVNKEREKTRSKSTIFRVDAERQWEYVHAALVEYQQKWADKGVSISLIVPVGKMMLLLGLLSEFKISLSFAPEPAIHCFIVNIVKGESEREMRDIIRLHQTLYMRKLDYTIRLINKGDNNPGYLLKNQRMRMRLFLDQYKEIFDRYVIHPDLLGLMATAGYGSVSDATRNFEYDVIDRNVFGVDGIMKPEVVKVRSTKREKMDFSNKGVDDVT